jgi:hypothetical protein
MVTFLPGRSSNSNAYIILVIPLLMSLAGCNGEGGGGPIISSLSAPTDATTGSDSEQDAHSEDGDHDDGDEDPIIMMTSTPTGVTARLTWDPPSGIDVAGYDIYYGKRSAAGVSSEESESEDVSSEEPLSCSRGEKQAVEAPSATITDLEPNTEYFFAIRAFNESESLCSNEIVAVTPSAQT